ncbi:dihydrolipoyllysine-residue acetyltransferase [Candidatus Nitrotoga fabula]|uniref:Acetyltransferase component of pyruvate dehydrogenase complex n=1 Tax=Candidatus Nitrotoga fabula TaxID=2182327 RepID=A0A916BBX4_9PROT|nr:dihydrolipoyllysine-residue acetyltransferase [Candidatus Nitrotoga fabula]CAE6701513.1 Acetyltransferase component of pyruvate dehydrogenase complex [Candidatus Nitrotoga fabula]
MAEIRQVLMPDIGDYKNVPVIEIMVKAGDVVEAEQPLLALETDKATMDVPAPFAGVVHKVYVSAGDKISEGSLILSIETDVAATPPVSAPPAAAALENAQQAGSPVAAAPAETPAADPLPVVPADIQVIQTGKVHASPSVRRFARELGVDLARVKGSGEKGRITKNDVQGFVKATLVQSQRGTGSAGLPIAAMPEIDFSRFGAIESRPLSRIKKLSGANLHRNWVTIPHITQHDEADITEMEVFRKELGEEYSKQGVKITPLAFILKAVVTALQQYPDFNSSLDSSGENLILKKYYHIGVAVDTPDGLVVPVLRDVDQKGVVQLARDLAEISGRAREKKLPATAMQGGCFSVSSLGGIGGTAFTPIINAPEVAILGVSRASIKPIYKEGEFVPRLMLPLSLSYDHRVIDGAAAAHFMSYLGKVLSDVRRLVL